jgi:hypothetical protein
MGLTRPVGKASNSYQNPKNALFPQNSPQFEGLMKLSLNNLSTNVSNLNFQLSNECNDNYQDKISHPQQTISSSTPSQFSCLQPQQGKMTVSRANSSYQIIPVRMLNLEDNSCNKCKSIKIPCIQKKTANSESTSCHFGSST